MTLLAQLPHDHPLRNAPLIDIGAEYRSRGGRMPSAWRPVRDAFLIARCTYNELSHVWTDHDDWRATRELDHA